MFNKKKIKELLKDNQGLAEKVVKQAIEIRELKRARDLPQKPTKADLMRDILGLPMLDFANVDKEGYPVHYLEGMSNEERKHYVAEMAIIYQNPKFITVTNYLINLFGNHAVRKPHPEEKNLGVYSMNGIKMMQNEFHKAFLEHSERNTPQDKFDPLATLPDVPA